MAKSKVWGQIKLRKKSPRRATSKRKCLKAVLVLPLQPKLVITAHPCRPLCPTAATWFLLPWHTKSLDLESERLHLEMGWEDSHRVSQTKSGYCLGCSAHSCFCLHAIAPWKICFKKKIHVQWAWTQAFSPVQLCSHQVALELHTATTFCTAMSIQAAPAELEGTIGQPLPSCYPQEYCVNTLSNENKASWV